jgi:hypothetical protein
VEIVDAISHLNLLEVADLNALLKSRLNISDAPVMMAGGPAAAPAAAPKEVTTRSICSFRIRDILVRIRSGSPCSVATPVSLVSMRIRIQLYFYLNADPDPEIQNNANPWGSGSGSWPNIKVTKSWIFTRKNTLK